jgi:REP element-mobilizing transposase RayT
MDRTGRQPRIHISNSVHHVMIRGNNRQRIFFDDEDFHFFLKIISESTEKFDHKIIAYCLMSNHAHLLVHIYDSPLSAVMQKINFRYARWLNHKEKRIGHLFQGRYRSLEVCDEEYLINLCRYIHFNPVVAKMVNAVDDYPWSSHQYYTENNYPLWIESDFILTAIKNKTNLSYFDFMMQPVDREAWKPAIYISETGKIIYNDDVLRDLQRNRSDLNPAIQHHLTVEEVLNIVCGELNIRRSPLFGVTKNHEIAKQRILVANYLFQYSGKNISEIARFFQRTHGTLSRQLKKFSQRPEKYFSIEVMKKIELLLSESILAK